MFIVLASIILMALSDATAFLPDRSYDIQIYHILPLAAVEVLIGYLMYSIETNTKEGGGRQGRWLDLLL